MKLNKDKRVLCSYGFVLSDIIEDAEFISSATFRLSYSIRGSFLCFPSYRKNPFGFNFDCLHDSCLRHMLFASMPHWISIQHSQIGHLSHCKLSLFLSIAEREAFELGNLILTSRHQKRLLTAILFTFSYPNMIILDITIHA